MVYPNTKLVMKSIDADNGEITTTIGYCNPNTEDGLLKEFAKKLNAFTTNTFESIQKVETTDVTDAEYFPYTATVESDTVTITSTADTVTNLIETTIPTDTEVTWSMTYGGDSGSLSVATPARVAGTGNFTVTLRAPSGTGTYSRSVTLKAKSSGEVVTNSITITANVSIEG